MKYIKSFNEEFRYFKDRGISKNTTLQSMKYFRYKIFESKLTRDMVEYCFVDLIESKDFMVTIAFNKIFITISIRSSNSSHNNAFFRYKDIEETLLFAI